MVTQQVGTLQSHNTRDSLLDALVSLTRLHHKPFSAESLVAGLPLVDGKLTPSLFVRAAERAGYIAKEVKRPLSDVSERVLPVALLLKGNQTCILLNKTEDTASVLFLEEEDVEQEMDITNLERLYTGTCLFCKPDSQADSEADTKGHWFWDTIRLSQAIYSEVLIASLMINLFALVTPLFIMSVYDRIVPNYAVETLWVLASGAFIVFLFDLLMKSLRGYFIDVAGKRADILLSSRTFEKVMNIKMDQRPTRVGSFANNLQEFDSFREFFTSTTLITVIDLPFVILFISLIFGIGGIIALVPLLAIPLILMVGVLLQNPIKEVIQQVFTESAKKHAMLIETLSALDAIKGAQAEGVMQRKWEEFNAKLAKLGLKSRVLSLSMINFSQTIQQMSTVAVVIVGVYLIMEGKLSVGGLIACTILTGRCLAPMGQVAGIITRYHHSLAAYGAIDNIMSLPVERPAGKKFLHRKQLDGNVVFNGVTFVYPEQKVFALQDVSFNISDGEKVAVIGKMGSGKSTLLRLILNFYQPKEGSILISGTDINQIDPTDLRRNITYVPQDIILLNGTIRENIVVGTPLADDEAVLRATKLSGLLDFINQHPQGFDLQVGERGSNLSGGQRQAVAIARAFIKDSSLLVLDEPTNTMDNTAEAIFKQHLTDLMSDKTLILVTHKTTMLSLADRIIVLNAGQLVADGPRDEVLQALAGVNNAAG